MECPEKKSFAGARRIPDVDQSDVVAVIRLVVLGVDAQPLGGNGMILRAQHTHASQIIARILFRFWVTLERTNKQKSPVSMVEFRLARYTLIWVPGGAGITTL